MDFFGHPVGEQNRAIPADQKYGDGKIIDEGCQIDYGIYLFMHSLCLLTMSFLVQILHRRVDA